MWVRLITALCEKIMRVVRLCLSLSQTFSSSVCLLSFILLYVLSPPAQSFEIFTYKQVQVGPLIFFFFFACDCFACLRVKTHTSCRLQSSRNRKQYLCLSVFSPLDFFGTFPFSFFCVFFVFYSCSVSRRPSATDWKATRGLCGKTESC